MLDAGRYLFAFDSTKLLSGMIVASKIHTQLRRNPGIFDYMIQMHHFLKSAL